jgi:hypothetical protein
VGEGYGAYCAQALVVDDQDGGFAAGIALLRHPSAEAAECNRVKRTVNRS